MSLSAVPMLPCAAVGDAALVEDVDQRGWQPFFKRYLNPGELRCARLPGAGQALWLSRVFPMRACARDMLREPPRSRHTVCARRPCLCAQRTSRLACRQHWGWGALLHRHD